jgi:hypothetical protein
LIAAGPAGLESMRRAQTCFRGPDSFPEDVLVTSASKAWHPGAARLLRRRDRNRLGRQAIARGSRRRRWWRRWCGRHRRGHGLHRRRGCRPLDDRRSENRLADRRRLQPAGLPVDQQIRVGRVQHPEVGRRLRHDDSATPVIGYRKGRRRGVGHAVIDVAERVRCDQEIARLYRHVRADDLGGVRFGRSHAPGRHHRRHQANRR